MLTSHLNSGYKSSSNLHVTNVICSSFDSIFYLDSEAILRVIDDDSELLDSYQIETSSGSKISEFKDIPNCKEICSIGEANLLLLDDGTVVYHYLVDAMNDMNAYIPQDILNNLINIEWIYCKYSTLTLLDSSNTLHCIWFNNLKCKYSTYKNTLNCKIQYSNLIILDTDNKITVYFGKASDCIECTPAKAYRTFDTLEKWVLCLTHDNLLEVYFLDASDFKVKYTHTNILDLITIGFETAYLLTVDYRLLILNCNINTKTVENLVCFSKYKYIDKYIYNSLNSNRSLIEFLKIDDKIVFKTKETILYSVAFDGYVSLDSKESFTDLDPKLIDNIYQINEYLIIKLKTYEYVVYMHASYFSESEEVSEFANKIKSINLLSQIPGSYI